jgi:hypothetical protein
MGKYPAIVDGVIQFAFNPGAAVADTATAAFVISGCAAKFNGSHALRVADVAKYYFSYAHKIS